MALTPDLANMAAQILVPGLTGYGLRQLRTHLRDRGQMALDLRRLKLLERAYDDNRVAEVEFLCRPRL